MKSLTYGIAWMGLMASSVVGAQTHEESTSMCQLVKAGAQMNGHHVRLSVIYMTDLLEVSVIKDPRCPEAHLVPNWNASQDPGLAAFDEALYARPDDSEATMFRIDVSGTFVWQISEKSHGSLILQKVWSFKRVRGDFRNAR